MRRNRRGWDALLGLVALGLFGGAVFGTWVFLKGGFASGVPVRAFFSGRGVGQQLPVGGDVKIRGVLVGTISDLTLNDRGEAVVHLRLDEGLGLPQATKAEIRSKTVFGQKWVELIPPDNAPNGSGLLTAGSSIPDSATIEPLELERALQRGHDLLSEIPLNDLATVFSTLAQGFTGSEDDARLAMDRGLVALRAVNSRAGDFDLALRQLNEFSAWLDDHDSDLISFLDSLHAANEALVGAAPELKASLDSFPRFLDELSDFQLKNGKSLGRLIQRGATLAELLAEHSDELTDIVVQLRPFTTVWNSGLSQPCEGLYEADMTCWQVYQMPGLESRGLYGEGEGPDEDEPGDPNYVPGADEPGSNEIDQLVSTYGERATVEELIQVLLGPTALPGTVTP